MHRPDPHLPFERLVDLVEDRLAGADAELARSHVAACAACAASFAGVEQIVALMRSDAASQQLEEPPMHVAQRAARLLSQHAPPPRRLFAALRFDSAAQPLAAAGVRALDPPGRQLVFSAGDYDLDLRLSQSTGEQVHTLQGQVLGPCAGSGRVALESPSVVLEARLDELCQFDLHAVPSGTYTLTVYLPEVSIEIGGVNLRSR